MSAEGAIEWRKLLFGAGSITLNHDAVRAHMGSMAGRLRGTRPAVGGVRVPEAAVNLALVAAGACGGSGCAGRVHRPWAHLTWADRTRGLRDDVATAQGQCCRDRQE